AVHRPADHHRAPFVAQLVLGPHLQAPVLVAGALEDHVVYRRLVVGQGVTAFDKDPAGEIVRPAIGVVHVIPGLGVPGHPPPRRPAESRPAPPAGPPAPAPAAPPPAPAPAPRSSSVPCPTNPAPVRATAAGQRLRHRRREPSTRPPS